MDLLTAERQRAIRLYEWSARAMAREMAEDFPTLDRVKNGMVVAAVTLLRKMPDEQRRVTCTGLVNFSHMSAAELLGEKLHAGEKAASQQLLREAMHGRGLRIAVKFEQSRGMAGPFAAPDKDLAAMTPASLESLAREALGEPERRETPHPKGCLLYYPRQYGDWSIVTRVHMYRSGCVNISYLCSFERADHGTGAPIEPMRPPNESLLGLLGLPMEYWNANTGEQVEEAFGLMRQNLDRFFAEIPPLLSDLTIE
jgi:hypothetical protein